MIEKRGERPFYYFDDVFWNDQDVEECKEEFEKIRRTNLNLLGMTKTVNVYASENGNAPVLDRMHDKFLEKYGKDIPLCHVTYFHVGYDYPGETKTMYLFWHCDGVSYHNNEEIGAIGKGLQDAVKDGVDMRRSILEKNPRFRQPIKRTTQTGNLPIVLNVVLTGRENQVEFMSWGKHTYRAGFLNVDHLHRIGVRNGSDGRLILRFSFDVESTEELKQYFGEYMREE